MIKFPTPWGIATLVSQTATMFECRKVGKENSKEPVEKVKPQEEVGPTEEVLVNLAHPDQLVTIDITGVPKRIIKHSLTANPSVTLELKKMILKLPSLTTPLPKEVLYIYLATSKEAVIVVQLANRKGKKCLVHYVSRTLHDVERNYASLEKLALTLLHVSRRLRRYFEAHPITVITEHPIKLNKAEASERLAKYSVELGAYNITNESRNAIKNQILADFINEVLVGSDTLVPRSTPYTMERQTDYKEEWVLYINGASRIKGSGTGLGMDVLGPLPEALGKVKFVIMAIDAVSVGLQQEVLQLPRQST
ncbi:reverse transcriptase domain-containing protein [Tanacetum coccineum]